MNSQFGRKATLVVSNGTLGLNLSELRFKFQTCNSDAETPNMLYVRVYNLKKETASQIGAEFNTVTIQAGYENGNFGIIFQGTIKQTAAGRERNVDNYVDIWAADGDHFFNYGIANQSLAAGATPADVIKAVVSAQVSGGQKIKFSDDAQGMITGGALGTVQTLSRGKVLWGMARDYATDWTNTYGFRWSIQNGEFVLVRNTGYRPGEAVVLSSTTGLIGVPDATDGGVTARALLNPLIRIGCLVQIAQGDLNRITTQQQGLKRKENPAATITTAAGFYRVMQAEFSGDTRGQPWYVDLVCLAVDVSASNQDQSVAAAG